MTKNTSLCPGAVRRGPALLLKHYLNWLQTRRYQVPGKKINLEQKVKERKFPAFEDLSFFRETEEKQIPDERKFQRVKWLPVLRGISPSQHRAILSNALSELQKKESPLLPPMLKFRKVSKVPGEKKAVNQEIDLYSRRPGIKIHSLPYILKYPSKPKGIKQEIHHRPIYRLCHFISDQPKFKIIHRLERFKKKATARPSCIVDFTPLNSIDRQYRNQKKMENFQNKIESVGMLQIATEDANENLQAHIQQKNHFIKKRAKEDKKKIEESLQKLQETRAKLMKKFQERRNFFKEEARTKAQERQIVIDKLSLHCSLAKEYFQYDRLKNRQDILKMKKSHVKEMREINLYHKELLEKMKNGRCIIYSNKVLKFNGHLQPQTASS
ncbi:leucine-rich repeat and IQ domain-containing protein 3-like [Macrotis lagotis]|uniref:leucine-rich repeat and IQ domain-containing protein 3-like n=1 Tax=Macrotis lagotis TaxID=92651 RepID=UPI003D697E25